MTEARIQRGPLAIASAGAFVAALSTSLVAVSTPVIAKELDVGPADASWVLSGYLLAVSSLLALAGRAGDVLGRKRVYLTGFVFFIAGSAMCAAAMNLFALVGARILQGAGAAMLMAIGPAIVTRAVPPAQRARGLAIQLAATYVGLMLGPSVGGALVTAIAWHAVFVVIAGAAAACGFAAVLFLEEDTPPPEPRSIVTSFLDLDPAGAALLAMALSALLVALKRGPEHGWTDKTVLAIAAFAVLALVIFVRHEAHRASPLLPLALFRTAAFASGIAGATLLYTITLMLSYLLPFELQREARLSPSATGLLMTAQPAVTAVVAPLGGWIADKRGARLPSIAGMLAIAIGMAGVSRTTAEHGAALVVSLAIVGLGSGLFVAANSALIMGAAPRERQGMAAAMLATSRNVGMTSGIAIAASLYRSAGFGYAVSTAAALALAGALLAAVRPVLPSRPR